MKRLLFLVVIIICVNKQISAQLQGQERLDSLLAHLPKANEDTNKVKLLIDLSHTYYSINPNEGLRFGEQGLALAEKLDWHKGRANANRTIAGNYGYGKSDYVMALKYSFKALDQFTEIEDKTGTARILGDIGVEYWYQSDYPSALKYYFDALRINEEINNKADIAATLVNIGIVYNSQKEYQKALEYMVKANRIDEESGNTSGVATNLGDIGELYHNLSDNTKALDYYARSLNMSRKLGDKNGVVRNLGNIGNVYTEQKNYSKAMEYYLQALQISRELGLKVGMAMNMGNMGNVYLQMAKDTTSTQALANLVKAKARTDSAIMISKEIGDLDGLSANYNRLSEMQMLLGDNKGALDSYKNYAVLKDSVFNMEKDKKLTEAAMQYAFDKKEAATKAGQDKKDTRQRTIRNSSIASVVVLLLLLAALINRYRYKQKAARELATAYENLKNTQQQLIQSEKLAAFGAMASRMAHEIQNPMNFVNNFSELSRDLVLDIVATGNEEERKAAAEDLLSNLEKINHHGNRASGIINRLQEHARLGTTEQFLEES